MEAPVSPVRLDSAGIGVRRRLVRRILWASYGCLALSAAVAVVGGGAALFLALASLAVMLGALVSLRLVWRREGHIAVDASGIEVQRGETTTRHPRDAVVSGWTVPLHDDAADVELALASGDIVTVRLGSQDDARALLEAVGVDATKQALKVRLGGDLGAGLTALVTAGFPMMFVLPCLFGFTQRSDLTGAAAVSVVLYVLMAAGFFALFRPPEVVVGVDGVSIKRLGRSRFIPYEDLREVAPNGSNVMFDLEDGTRFNVMASNDDVNRPRAVAARVNEARFARARSPGSEALALLDRNGRTLHDWKLALGGILQRDQGYRQASLTRADVERVLADPTSPAERRVAAAMALAGTQDPKASTRVRAAIDVCADERVRVALEKSLGDDLDEETLEAISERREA